MRGDCPKEKVRPDSMRMRALAEVQGWIEGRDADTPHSSRPSAIVRPTRLLLFFTIKTYHRGAFGPPYISFSCPFECA